MYKSYKKFQLSVSEQCWPWGASRWCSDDWLWSVTGPSRHGAHSPS